MLPADPEGEAVAGRAREFQTVDREADRAIRTIAPLNARPRRDALGQRKQRPASACERLAARIEAGIQIGGVAGVYRLLPAPRIVHEDGVPPGAFVLIAPPLAPRSFAP